METYPCFAFLAPTMALLFGLAFLMGGV